MSNVLAQSVEKKGTFKIIVHEMQWIKDGINGIAEEYAECNESDFESEEAFENFCKENSLNADQQKDLAEFRKYLDPEFDWSSLISVIPRKANGTFAKNRRPVLHEGHSFRWVCEESYGERGPQLSLKTISDTEAVLEFDSSAVIYKY